MGGIPAVEDTGVTVDALARASGTTVRSVRALQSSGLLPGPTLHGRTGRYSKEHLQRLRAIHRLQAEGFSLAAIRTLLVAWDDGLTLEEVLGLPARPRRRGDVGASDADPFEPFEPWQARRGPALAVVPSTILHDAHDATDVAAS
jgi:DNA-binding transcriptional MerR regulator